MKNIYYNNINLNLEKSVIIMLDNTGKTRTFSVASDKELEMFQIMSAVYASLKENGYDPINQLVGYILSEDPTYITNRNNARGLIRKIDRDELLRTLVRSYLGITEEV